MMGLPLRGRAGCFPFLIEFYIPNIPRKFLYDTQLKINFKVLLTDITWTSSDFFFFFFVEQILVASSL